MPTVPSLSDLYTHGAPSESFGSLTNGDRSAALASAYAELEAAASSQGTVPLVSISADLTAKVCQIAAYELLCRVGFNPNAGADRNYLDRALAARGYFRDIAKGIVRPLVTFSTARTSRAQPQVRSKPIRGW